MRDEWARQTADYQNLLRGAVQTAGRWIARIEDHDFGAVGSSFEAKVDLSGCTHAINMSNSGTAVYSSFSYRRGEEGFVNRITYGVDSIEDMTQLFSARVHESTHALQKMESAALHASPFNPNTRIIICPRDWVMLEERCEQEAYAKQAWFNSLLAETLPEIEAPFERHALSPRTFRELRQAAGSLDGAMVEAARASLTKSFYSDAPNAQKRFAQHYHDVALKNYEAGMKMREKCGENGFIFVRLEPEDIAAIGNSFGPNSFCENGRVLPEFLAPARLLPEDRTRLEKLNHKFYIYDADRLPTLGQVLAARGLTRRDFIAASSQDHPPANQMPRPAP